MYSKISALTGPLLHVLYVSFCMFLAGYNNVEVAEFLLENGADVNVQDKGGLIPLHNASSYGVSLLVKSQTLLFVLLHPQLMKMGQRYT